MSDYRNKSKAAVLVNNNDANDGWREHQKSLNQLHHQPLSTAVWVSDTSTHTK